MIELKQNDNCLYDDGKPGCGESMHRTDSVNLKNLGNIINEIRKACDTVMTLLQEMSNSLMLIDDSVRNPECDNIGPKNEKPKNMDCSLEQKAFSTLGYTEGGFYTYRTIEKDLKKACTALGLPRRPFNAALITQYYDVKFCKRKVKGVFEWGFLVLGLIN